MPLILTPGQLARRADFYQQLSQLTGAGLGLVQALELQARTPPDRTFREPLQRVLAKLGSGATLSDSMRAAGPWLPPFDLALLEAAERSGRLPVTFELLAAHYTSRAQMLRQTLSSLAYPVFVLHLAVIVACLLDLFRSGSFLRFGIKLLGFFLPFYLLILFGIYAAQGRRGEHWRSLLERMLHRVPLVGAARRNLAIARLAAALEALLSAGVNVFEAWEMAATASGSPALQGVVQTWRPRLEAGVTPADTVAQAPEFPEMFANMYRTGEISGTLDTTLRRMHILYLEQGTAQLKAFVEWLPKILFLLVAGLVAYVAITFWIGYFKTLGNVLNL